MSGMFVGTTRLLRPYRTEQPVEPCNNLDIFQCQNCQLGFAIPVPTSQALDSYYATEYRSPANQTDIYAHPWGGAAARSRSQIAFFRDGASQHSITNWLDIGAGFGFLLDEIKQKGVETAGIEPDFKARERLVKVGHHVFEALGAVDGT